ncbi:HigA family addiction module antitoxin [Flavobacterium pectinovorum]|uniref:HigA family addiction module antitoxin n=1 Tax=Flavobacterium pectinovorum TaxID=29533 RepID=UPI001FAD9611|nr:HigA family addiction module antitoxin [Flavobacterium pectinovorum]MCI9843732.1 HigA family addiction module antidote protein [Flavobacterium pectinovorum]
MTAINQITPFEATHPGTLIKDELEVRDDIKQKDLAELLGVKPSFLNEIIKGKRPITADLAILLEKTLEIPADYWMKFQSQYEIDCARIKEKNINKIKLIELWNIIKEYVPVNYFKKQGYLTENLEENINKIKLIYAITTIDGLVNIFATKKFAFYKKSEKLKIDDKNMIAWNSLAEYEAKNQSINTFNFDNIDSLTKSLNDIFFENDNTLFKVKKVLNQYGVKFSTIEKLEKTPVDGYSFWSENNPAIAVTLRHSRIDNFAFTIMHEIGHIALHLKNNKEQKFLDLTNQEVNHYETEANDFAQKKLISEKCWEDIVQNYIPLDDNEIEKISKKYNIHPAIILGRACYEMSYYALNTSIDKKLK